MADQAEPERRVHHPIERRLEGIEEPSCSGQRVGREVVLTRDLHRAKTFVERQPGRQIPAVLEPVAPQSGLVPQLIQTRRIFSAFTTRLPTMW